MRGRAPISAILFFAAAATGVLLYYIHLIAKEPQPLYRRPFDGYETTHMQGAVAPQEVAAEQERILGLGDRFLGDEGFYATASYLKNAWRSAGLDIFEQEIVTPAPRTRHSS